MRGDLLAALLLLAFLGVAVAIGAVAGWLIGGRMKRRDEWTELRRHERAREVFRRWSKT